LGGRIGRQAGRAAEQGDGGDSGEGLVQARLGAQVGLCKPDDREGGIPCSGRQARTGDDDLGEFGRGELQHEAVH